MAQIKSAATDEHAQETLDIAWIDSLPAHLKNSIDEGFADSVAEAATKQAEKTDGGLKNIDKEIDQQEKDLQAAAVARLATADPSITHKHGRALEQALATDPMFVHAKAQLETDRAQRKQQRKLELRTAADGPMAAGSREDTVAKPTTAKVTRLEGKALARTNFMSWAIDVLGSTQAAKQHFLSIQEVSRQPGMFLIAKAKARFEAARADFEAKHPGASFPSTDVGQSLRGFHQARQGIGMLGHALGVAFDFLAYDNPNQKLGDTDNYGYLLNRFGGNGDTRGRSVMTLGNRGEDTVAQLGRDTEANRSSPAGDAMIEKIRTQFDEMAATSDRLKSSMAAELPVLSEARDTYFNSKATEEQLAQATKDDHNAERIADKRLKDEKFTGDDAAKAIHREEIKRELRARKEQLQTDLDAAKTSVKRELATAFAGWAAMIEADLAAARTRQATSEAEIAAQTKAKQDLDAIDVLEPDAVDALNAFADQYQLKKPRQPPTPARYKLILKNELAAKQKPRNKTDPLSITYIQNEIAALNQWQVRIHDPKLVFGEGKVVPAASLLAAGAPAAGPAATPAGSNPASTPAAAADAPPAKHWATKMQVSNAPILQFIEHGFIRHDDMPARSAGGDAKQVFNAEVATTLARFGFSPGAAFRDTMHFDFIEGYGAAPGGRGQANMIKTKYGPSGDKP